MADVHPHSPNPPPVAEDGSSDDSPERYTREGRGGSLPRLVASPVGAKAEAAAALEREVARLLVCALPQAAQPPASDPPPAPATPPWAPSPADPAARRLFSPPDRSDSPSPPSPSSPPRSPPGFMAARRPATPPSPTPLALSPAPRPSRKLRPVARCRKRLALLSVAQQSNPAQWWERRPPLPGQRRPAFVNCATGAIFGVHRTRHRDAEEERELELALRLSLEATQAADDAEAEPASGSVQADEAAPTPTPLPATPQDRESEAGVDDSSPVSDSAPAAPVDPDPEAYDGGIFSESEGHGVCAFCQVDTRSRAATAAYWAALRQRCPAVLDRPLGAVAAVVGPVLGPFSVGAGGTGVKRPKKNPSEIWAHDLCLLWCPEVYELEEGRFVNLEQAHRRARKGMACHLCGRPGATLGCHVSSCRRNYHVLCALLAEDGVDPARFVLFCPQHREAAAASE